MYCIDKKTSNGEESNNKRYSFSLMMYESQDGFENEAKGRADDEEIGRESENVNDDTSHVEKKRVSNSLMRGDPPLLSLYGKTDTLRRHTLSKRKLFFASQVRLPPTFFCRGN